MMNSDNHVKIKSLQLTLNKPENLPPKAYRRDSCAYELISYINNITGCYLSENLHPVSIFIDRARFYMDKNQKKEFSTYYSLVYDYLLIMEKEIVRREGKLMGVD